MSKKKKKTNKPRKLNIGFVSLGCPKNTVDSESMLGRLFQNGFCITGDIRAADIAVINTCGFIEPAKREALDTIKEIAEYKQTGRLKAIIAVGCLAERMGQELLSIAPDIDAVVGLAGRDNIAEIAAELVHNKPKSREQKLYLSDDKSFVSEDTGRLLINAPHYAFLRISEGCSRGCAFCTIPAIRGKFRSKPLENIRKEAAELAAAGVKELIIIAQDTSNYGRDLAINDGLRQVLEMLEELDFQWIRVMYLYPANVTDGLIKQMAGSDKVLPYFDMPIQHIEDDILKSMRRLDSREKTTALIEKLRTEVPGAVLRTTVITGYPGETDRHHQKLVEFIKWAKFDALGCFTFYPEKGTAAAELEDKVSEQVKDARLDEIMTTQQKIVFEKNEAMIGRELKVLVDCIDGEGAGEGRYYGQAPDIDGICVFSDCRAEAGDFVKAKVAGFDGYDLLVEQLN